MASRDTKLKIIVDAENRSQGAFNAVKNNLDGLRQSHAGLISAMKTVGTVSTVALGGLSLLTKGIIGVGASFEQTQIAFETMLGSAETARVVLGDLAKFAARTPFELPQLEDASKRLLAYGTSAEELIPTLEMLGNISAGVGMDKLPQLILAFGQVKAATRLTGAELRQFSEAGVPLLGALAKQLNRTEAEIIDMVSEGAVGFAEMKAALGSLTGEGGKFFNLMERQSQSLGGLWSNFKDQLNLTARAIGTELLPYLKPLAETMIRVAQGVGQFVKDHPQLSAIILGAALAFALIGAALLPIALVLPGLILMFSGLSAALLFIATGPGLAVVASIIGIVTALTYLWKEGYFTKQAWLEVWDGIKIIAAEGANAVINIIESMVNWVIAQINDLIAKINRVLSLARKIPGVSSKLKLVPELEAVSLSRFSTESGLTSNFSQRPALGTSPSLTITGNTFLSEDAAERMGDLILSRLKMSAAL